MRTSFRTFSAFTILGVVLGSGISATAIEPVGSASRGTSGASSRRPAAPIETAALPKPATATRLQTAPKAATKPSGGDIAQSASAQLAAAPPAASESEPALAPTPGATSAPQSVAALSPTARAGGPFGWQTNVEEACRVARRHNLPVLVFVTSAHCPYCTKMKEQTFRSAAVINEVDANFVPLKIERGSAPALERQLGIKSYPTTIILRGDKVEMARMAGFIQAPQFVGNLKKIEAQWPTMSAARPTTKR